MKIQEDLMWDEHTGELIGFVGLLLNYATLKNVPVLATHILVFLVKSVANPLSYSFATFATTGITSYQIFPLLWKAVNILENINLKKLLLLQMEPRLIVNSFACINFLVVVQRKLLFIDLKTYLVKKNVISIFCRWTALN